MRDDQFVSVPLGLVALTWIRLFKPLLAASLPQNPSNIGIERLGFVKEGFRKLQHVSHLDLRVGLSMTGDDAKAMHAAIKDAADTITKMPATYMTYPDGSVILPVERRRPVCSSLVTGTTAAERVKSAGEVVQRLDDPGMAELKRALRPPEEHISEWKPNEYEILRRVTKPRGEAEAKEAQRRN